MSGFKTTFLKSGNDPYVIAEIGINHNGRMELARRMIDASREAGADAVKFQKRDIGLLVRQGVEITEPTGYLSADENDLPSESKAFGTWTYPDKRLEFSDEQYVELWEYCKFRGVEFIVSPWEENSVDFLADHGAKVIKVASIDATNYQFCEYIASKGVPTLVSTGMANYSELQLTWEIFNRAGCPMMFLHCTSAYPCPIEDKHLRVIPVLRAMFEEDVGFSGHGVGPEGTLGAVALGASVVEKHVTLSRAMSGPDHAASLEFDEFGDLIRMSRNMTLALGHARKDFLQSEATLHGVLTRKIITTAAIAEGATFTGDLLTTVVTKSEGGLLPKRYLAVVGSTATRDLPEGHVLEHADVDWR